MLERRLAEQRVRGCHPHGSGFEAVESDRGHLDQPGHPKEPVGLVGREASRGAPTGQRPGGDPDLYITELTGAIVRESTLVS